MPLAGMDRRQARGAPGGQQPAVRLDRPTQLRDVVAEHLAEPAGLEEVALHVDDQQGAMPGRQLEGIGFGRELYDLAHMAPPRFEKIKSPSVGSRHREMTALTFPMRSSRRDRCAAAPRHRRRWTARAAPMAAGAAGRRLDPSKTAFKTGRNLPEPDRGQLWRRRCLVDWIDRPRQRATSRDLHVQPRLCMQ